MIRIVEHAAPPTVEFWLDFIPKSLKNTPHKFTKANRDAKRDLKNQRNRIALEALVARRDRGSFGAHNIGVHLDEFPLEDAVRVSVMDLGPAPSKGRTGRRRDLGNIDALVHDALQGVLYDDDRQLVEISSHRHLCPKEEHNPFTTSDWDRMTLETLLAVLIDIREGDGKVSIGTMSRVAMCLWLRGLLEEEEG